MVFYIIIEITILAPSGGDKAKQSPYFDSAHIIYPKKSKNAHSKSKGLEIAKLSIQFLL